MTPEMQIVINVLLALVSAVLGWYLKVIHQSMRDLQAQDQILADKVQRIEVLVAGQYVQRPELEKYLDGVSKEMNRRFDRLENKLDSKADRA